MANEDRVRMTLRIVPKLNKKLEKQAKEKGKSKNAVIVDALWKWFEVRKDKE